MRRGITKAGAGVLRVRVLRAEKQLHVQVQGQVQVHANVQGSAWQQQSARAMCSGEQAAARSDPFVSHRTRSLSASVHASARRSESPW